MTTIAPQDGIESFATNPPEPSGGNSRRLSGKMTAKSLALTVLAFSAPLAVVTGFIPFTIIFAGQGAPFGFVVTTVLMLIFSVGYVAMTRHVPKPGAFYSFITTGLGKVFGLGSAFLATVAYIAILTGTYVFLGVSTAGLVSSFGGPETPWYLWAALGWAIVSTLGYFHIELSAKILSLVMIAEVIIVLIFNVAVFAQGGAEGLSLVPFTPAAFLSGNVPVTILFAVLVFLGFEATALFRDEVRNPNKTIPRATYGAVLFVGILYIMSSYALISAYGAEAGNVAATTPGTMFPDAIGNFVAPVFTQIAFIFLITSLLAALISVHNVLARYIHNLATDNALPAYVSKVHVKHGSPHRASMVVAVLVFAGLLPFVVVGADGPTLYAALTGVGSLGVLVLMSLVSLAVIIWFARNGVPASENIAKVFIAPAIAGISLLATAIFALFNFELIVGGAPGQNIGLALILAIVFIAGSALALFFRYTRPQIYDRLGGADRAHEGSDAE